MIPIQQLQEAAVRAKGAAIITEGTISLTWQELQKLIDVLPEVTGDFPITSVCKQDLAAKGFDIGTISNTDMYELASKMEDDYCEQLFWDSMKIIAEGLGFQKH